MTEAEQLAISYIDDVCKSLADWKDGGVLRSVERFLPYMDDSQRRFDYRGKLMATIGSKAMQGVSVRDDPLEIQGELSTAIFKCVCEKFGAEKFPMRVICWNDSTVLKITKKIYEGNNYKDSGILGDALEDAGYENSAIVAHLRESKFGKFHRIDCLIIQNLYKVSEFIDL